MTIKRHLIAIDLDGTLLKNDKTISHTSKSTINKAIDAGHIVIISTGRPNRASIGYYHELELNTPMINFNGALITHPFDRDWETLHYPVPQDIAKKVAETCYTFDVKNIIAEIQDNIYLDKFDQTLVDIFEDFSGKSNFTIGNIKDKLDGDPTSVMIQSRASHMDELHEKLSNIHKDEIECKTWGGPFSIMEVVKKDIHKAFAVSKVAEYFNIKNEHVIAFGDEGNDIEMITQAGIGVAMGNGIDILKETADYVTDSNEKDGVSSFLESYLQLEKQAVN